MPLFYLYNFAENFLFRPSKYMIGDVVLIVLWVLASVSDARYISVVACFVAFLANDIYGYISWQKMKVRRDESR